MPPFGTLPVEKLGLVNLYGNFSKFATHRPISADGGKWKRPLAGGAAKSKTAIHSENHFSSLNSSSTTSHSGSECQ
ncbi:hypothetical protein PROAA_1520009 [Candidatus Propionivibrio aalborgensis]|uniref:Uncharacterized protein n=1 Tax=Candidatus Propionivibrio aalborgensis TaxID=1860101 RepID=A0A1A8XJT6_9RHOO|nr:hypothetical protein PROAA_1520009 [Candidatus Propionivibrio aalborgensis]